MNKMKGIISIKSNFIRKSVLIVFAVPIVLIEFVAHQWRFFTSILPFGFRAAWMGQEAMVKMLERFFYGLELADTKKVGDSLEKLPEDALFKA